MSDLLSLPDELLLSILSSYDTIRSNEPQSQAFKDKEKERARQRENRSRQLALRALCLVSRRLNCLCTPVLYASFFGSATNYGFEPLILFSRTVSARDDLAKHIQYVENRLSDYLGNDLAHDATNHGAEHMIPEYFRLLGSIIRTSPNLQQLCVISIENSHITLWNHIFGCGDEVQLPSHGFLKLGKVALQTNANEERLDPENGRSFSRICSGLSLTPNLSSVRASGAVTGRWATIRGRFKKLRFLSISETIIDVEDIIEILRACDELHHFACQWEWLSYVNSMERSTLNLLLRQHQHSLRTLKLGATRFNIRNTLPDYLNIPGPRFQDFMTLKEATLPSLWLFGLVDPQSTAFLRPIASFFQPTLERLTITDNSESLMSSDVSLLLLDALWALTLDCECSLPLLREIIIEHHCAGDIIELETVCRYSREDVVALIKKFHELGLRLKFVHELDAFA